MSQLPLSRQAALYRYRIPLLAPLRIGDLQLSVREGLVVDLQEGQQRGQGEVAPLPGFSKETLQQAAQQLIDQLPHWLQGRQSLLTIPSAAFGMDCACAELSNADAIPLNPPCQGHPLLSGSNNKIIERWQNWQSPLPDLVKLKLGRQSLAKDIALLQKLVAISPDTRFRIDANRAWTLQQGISLLAAIPRACIDYLEEPCHELSETLALAQQQQVFIALDESARDAGFKLPASVWIRALILKPSLTGSINRLSEITRSAQSRGINVILSSSYESSLGISHILQLSQQLTPHQPAGIDTLQSFSANLLRTRQTDKPTLKLSDMELLWRS